MMDWCPLPGNIRQQQSLADELQKSFRQLTVAVVRQARECPEYVKMIREEFESNGRDPDVDPPRKRIPEFSSACWKMVKASKKASPLLSMSPKTTRSECAFCKNNGEMRQFYQSHALKERSGRITCPILRKYTCPVCQASGDNAHTLKYCPQNQGENKQESVLGAMQYHRYLRTAAGKIKMQPEKVKFN